MAPKKPAGKDNRQEIRNKYARTTVRERVGTGIIILDTILGGGLPVGSLVEIHSPSGTGKTTLMLQMCGNLMDKGFTVSYIDSETAVTSELLIPMGLQEFVDNGKMIVYNEVNLFSILDDVLKAEIMHADPKHIIIIDSITMVNADSFLDDPVTKGDMGSEARLTNRLLKKYKARLVEKNVTMILVNQMRANQQSQTQYDKTRVAGGKALEYMPDIRIEMKNGKAMERNNAVLPDGTVVPKLKYGVKVKIGCIKNKTAPPFIFMDMPLEFGKGVSNIKTLVSILISKKYASMTSGWYKTKILDSTGENMRTFEFGNWVKDRYDAIYEMLKADGIFDLKSYLDTGTDDEDDEE